MRWLNKYYIICVHWICSSIQLLIKKRPIQFFLLYYLLHMRLQSYKQHNQGNLHKNILNDLPNRFQCLPICYLDKHIPDIPPQTHTIGGANVSIYSRIKKCTHCFSSHSFLHFTHKLVPLKIFLGWIAFQMSQNILLKNVFFVCLFCFQMRLAVLFWLFLKIYWIRLFCFQFNFSNFVLSFLLVLF